MANQPPTAPTAELLAQTVAVGEQDTMVTRLRVDGLDPTTLTVDVAVFGALAPGSTTTEPVGSPISRWTAEPIGGFSLAPTGLVTVRLPIREGGGDGVRLPDPGVYPMVIRLSDALQTVVEIPTTVVRLADATLPNPTPISVAVAVDVGPGATLSSSELSELVRRTPDIPLTEVLARTSDGLGGGDPTQGEPPAVGDTGPPVVVRTDPPLDPSALAAVGLGDLYRAATGAAIAEADAKGRSVDRSAIVIDEPLTSGGADLLLQLGFTTAVLTEARSAASAPWPMTTGRLVTGTGSILVVRADPSWPAETLRGPGSAASRVQELVALMLLNEPAQTAGVVVAGLGDLDDPVTTLSLLLETLAATPLFRVEALSNNGFGRSPGLPGVEPAPVSRQDLASLTDQLDQVEGRLVTYSSFHLEGPGSPDDYRRELRMAFDVGLDADARREAIAGIADELENQLGTISLPGNQSVTLAARTASLPIAVDNAATGSRRVRVRLSSDKVRVIDPDQIITVPVGASVIELEVETRSLGASPATVTILTPDGTRTLASTRFQVRSTAIPGLGLLLSATGLALLGMWWYLSIRRNRSAHPSRSDHRRRRSPVDLRRGDRTDSGDGDADTDPNDRGPVTAGDSV